MRDKKFIVTLGVDERNIVMNALNGFCKDHVEETGATKAVDDVLIKLVDASKKKEKRRHDHETR